jgi:hypothetical protein
MAERSSSTVSFPGIASRNVLTDVLRQRARQILAFEVLQCVQSSRCRASRTRTNSRCERLGRTARWGTASNRRSTPPRSRNWRAWRIAWRIRAPLYAAPRRSLPSSAIRTASMETAKTPRKSRKTPETKRTGRDSNPRWSFPHAGFQDRCLKPLGHPSGSAKRAVGRHVNGLCGDLLVAAPRAKIVGTPSVLQRKTPFLTPS